MTDLSIAGSNMAGGMRRAILPFLALGLVLAVIAALLIGPTLIGPMDIWLALFGGDGRVDASTRAVVWDLRLPRALMTAIVGAVLAAAGAMMQGLFRNPLADPGLVGVSGGAALAAAAFIVFGAGFIGGLGGFGFIAMPLASFLGGLVTVSVIRRLSTRDGHTDIATMLLAGTAVNAIVFAGIGLLVAISDDTQLRSITFWSLGSMGGAGWQSLLIVTPFGIIALAAGLALARNLDALMLGEADAYCLGFDVERAKRILVLSVAAGVGAAVSFTGLIGFVGIIAPHMARSLLGPMHRRLLPGAACIGGALLVLADTLCRTIIAPAELPIGVVTSLIGAPVFLALLLQRQRGAA